MGPLPILRFVILAVLIGLHVGTAAIPDVYDELSGQYAATAWEMVESGTWLIPTLDGVPRLQKPPLVYWLTAAALRIGGRSEFAARLPTALALVGVMLATVALGGRLAGPAAGLIAGVVFATLLGTMLLGKLIMPEPFLALGVALSLLATVRLVEDPARARGWALAAWAAVAFASFSKGLHGLLLPAAIVAVLALARPSSRRALAGLAWWPGPVLFLGMLLPWYLYVEREFPGFLVDNLLNEQIGHLLDTHVPQDSEPTPLGVFWSQHLVWWFPWVLFIAAGIRRRADAPAHPLAALPAVWLAVTALAMSFTAQRQDYYSMVAWPAFALMVARAWPAVPTAAGGRRALAIPFAGLAGLGVLGLAVYVAGPDAVLAAPASNAPFGERNSLGGALSGISVAEWRRLWPLLVPAATGVLVGGGGGLLMLRWPRSRDWSWLPLAAGSVVVLLAAMIGLHAFSPYFGLKTIALALQRRAEERALIVYDGPSHRGSSLCFYTSAPVRWLEAPSTEFAVRSRGTGHDRFIDEPALVAVWQEGAAAYLVTEEGRVATWRARLGEPVHVVARSGTRVLLAR